MQSGNRLGYFILSCIQDETEVVPTASRLIIYSLFISILSSRSSNDPGNRYTELYSVDGGFDPLIQLLFSRLWAVQTTDASLCSCSNGLHVYGVTRLPLQFELIDIHYPVI